MSRTINNDAFARAGGEVSGRLKLSAVCDDGLFLDGNAEVHYVLRGGEDSSGALFLHCELRGALPLQCLACMQPMTLTLDESRRYPLRTESTAAEPEWLEADGETDIERFICDEILMAVPFAPRHTPRCGGQKP